MLKSSYKRLIAFAGIMTVIAICIIALGNKAYANPSAITATTQTALATTSPAYLTATTAATTTLTYDSGATTVDGGARFIANSLVLASQFIGSSTSAVLKTEIEYSNDGIDWYRNFLSSTSPAFATGNPISWTYALTQLGGQPGVTTAKQIITVAAPTRYVRAVMSISGANASVWAQFIPAREIK